MQFVSIFSGVGASKLEPSDGEIVCGTGISIVVQFEKSNFHFVEA